MCLNPVQILNPHYYTKAYRSELGELVEVPAHLVSRRKYIDVPCGQCADCRNTYYNSILQRCIVEADSSYLYFVTLTYDNDHIPSVTIDDTTIYYSDYTHIQNMFKRLRDSKVIDRDFRYICVNEYGTEKYRPHFHLLIFVSKLDTDTTVTPSHFEDVLFRNLGKYFAVNHGTRKCPKYEKLFTYHIKPTPFGFKTNYFVKYVDTTTCNVQTENANSLVKTIRYLISYINKPNKFEEFILQKLSTYRVTDPILYRKLAFLRSRVRFSKGLGFGFINGKKHYLHPISVAQSYNVSQYNLLREQLPSSYHEFEQQYPELAQSVIHYMYNNHMRRYETLDDYLIHLGELNELKYYFISFIYFPKTMSELVRMFFFSQAIPTISYHFKYLDNVKYAIPKISTYQPDFDSPVYKKIRNFVKQGINNRVPFIPFVIGGSTPIFTPLCNFYKRYCCTMADVNNMYFSVGVSSYDEWKDLFENSLTSSMRKSHISKANTLKHKLSENLICISQNISLPLYQTNERDIYSIIFVH